jgi:hypothetical protein
MVFDYLLILLISYQINVKFLMTFLLSNFDDLLIIEKIIKFSIFFNFLLNKLKKLTIITYPII